jgi:hypothetical protein
MNYFYFHDCHRTLRYSFVYLYFFFSLIFFLYSKNPFEIEIEITNGDRHKWPMEYKNLLIFLNFLRPQGRMHILQFLTQDRKMSIETVVELTQRH